MYRSRADLPASSQRGFVLLATLWVMVLLGVLLATMSYQVRVEATLERRFLDQSQLRLAARGAIHMAIARIKAQDEQPFHSLQDEWWATTEHWQNLEIGDVRIDLQRAEQPVEQQNEEQAEQLYGPVDGESRLNINIATVEQLTLVPGFTDEIAQRIVQFRESLVSEEAAVFADQNTVSEQAPDTEDDQTVELHRGPLTSIDLMLKEVGVDRAELDAEESQPPLNQLLTSVSSGRINVNTALPQVLATLGLSSDQVAGLFARRSSAPFESIAEVQSELGLTENSEQWEQLESLLDIRSATFELSAYASLENKKLVFVIDAFVFSDGERWRVVRWAEHVSNG